jgi:copper chaperone NosL
MSVRRRALRALARVAVPLALLACASEGPRPIAYGDESCGYCRMTITDPRFGAEARTETGRVQTFDSIECLAAYADAAETSRLRGTWVTDYNRPGTLVPADSATFWQVDGGVSPMGRGLLATAGGRRPAGVADAGAPLDWAAVRALVARDALRPGSAEPHAH